MRGRGRSALFYSSRTLRSALSAELLSAFANDYLMQNHGYEMLKLQFPRLRERARERERERSSLEDKHLQLKASLQ